MQPYSGHRTVMTRERLTSIEPSLHRRLTGHALIALLFLGLAAHPHAASYSLAKLWETKPVLMSAESVLYERGRQMLYVSNMGPSKSPSAKDGDGTIGRLALDGRVIDASWVEGLNAPKGMGLSGGALYVADIDRLVVIDLVTGKVTRSVAIAGATSLNDVTVDDAGTVFVSDYQQGKVFAVKDGNQYDFLENIDNPNGILASRGEFFVLARGVLYQILPDRSTKAVVVGLDRSVDGIEAVSGTTYLVSCSKGIVYAVDIATGEKQTLLDQREAGILSADIAFDADSSVVYVPSLFSHQVSAYRLKVDRSKDAQAFSFDCPDLDGTTPEPAVRRIIERQEQRLLSWVLSGNQAGLDTMLADAMSYVHENGQVSTKEEFFRDYLPHGYIDVRLEPKEEMRQFCNTVTTVSRGYFRLKGEREYPMTAVTHIWAKTTNDEWVLVHRHESHKGPAIGPLLPQEGGVNNSATVGAKPSLEVARVIAANEAAWCRAMVENDAAVMEEFMNDSLHYVHVTDHTSYKDDFMHELSTGFVETDFKGTTLRQFGNTVIALHNAHYWHTDLPDQSRSQAMHCWVKIGDKWQIVSRHSARFLPY